ncbi:MULTISPECIES: DUF4254 domain-containing protein [unclassified Leeuwenhoekiella]|uniref:DUF4254 domain-containing protein n=2 Tax=Leeuwenhoekiella TaxID=283735 RepID=UPI000C4070C9|nr:MULTISPECIES: DUF4254 domain-containing protein [unclassified Leeuwenhoekiella]MAW96021.1 hypothetical protein [Leeuwenhoekiella sp.]MBA80015.1 hypothetical protein [Leeuwenhoekiella sp.]|tara:strand:+ start:17187 stop:17801 length:615 start_codon:yes stop_codon:yes gene_type:complete
MITHTAKRIFERAVDDYHIKDRVDQPFDNPYDTDVDFLEHLLYRKAWIDTVQWHYEDLIRDPNIDPVEALELKRKIDASNQDRTDMVEYIDSYFLKLYRNVEPNDSATINTESPAWALDRLAILTLKIYHMEEEANREDASDEHKIACQNKLDVLIEQRVDLCTAIDTLVRDIESGDKYMKVYKQMKMYNDDELNPVLRSQNKK